MGTNPIAHHHGELIVWQLCAKLRELVLMATRQPHVRADYRFCSDIRAAARSACYLVSEGFYRKRDGDFINFLIMARGSLGEVSDQVGDGHDCGHFTKKQADEMVQYVKRASKASSRLRAYLEECLRRKRQSRRPPPPRPFKRRRVPLPRGHTALPPDDATGSETP